MKLKTTLSLALFFFIHIAAVSASEIVVREADSIWGDTLQYSDELVNVSKNVSPKILVVYSNSIYRSKLQNVPQSLADQAGHLPSTRRLIVNHAASTYRVYLVLPQLTVSVEEKESANNLPKEFRLFQSYPNPFNPTTSIRYAFPNQTYVRLVVYNLEGQMIRLLVNKLEPPGEYNVVWDGTDDSGMNVGSGIYFYMIKAGKFKKTGKMILLR